MEQAADLAAVTILAVLEQAYFFQWVIYARRKYSVAPPSTSGPAAFERVFRAQANCSEYFPIFIAVLWVAGLFFHHGLSCFCGLLYLYGRYRYFKAYTQTPLGRLAPLYFSAVFLWALIGLSLLGVLCCLVRSHLGIDLAVLVASYLRADPMEPNNEL